MGVIKNPWVELVRTKGTQEGICSPWNTLREYSFGKSYLGKVDKIAKESAVSKPI